MNSNDHHPSLLHTFAILALGALVANGYALVAWLWWHG